jgi:carbonic anhydrase
MKTLITILSLLCFTLLSTASIAASKATHAEKQSNITPKQALELLKEGNKRFVTNRMRQYNYAKDMKITSKKGQFPLAVILSCIDSRSIPDLLLDQGIGNIFVSRTAGNVAGDVILGGMEFATKIAGAKLVIVMGHNHCGAVQGACLSQAETGLNNLDKLLNKILPAVATLKREDKNLNCKTYPDVDRIAKQNVLNQMTYIYNNSAVIKKQVDDKQIYLLGAMHDIRSGQVIFFDINGKNR